MFERLIRWFARGLIQEAFDEGYEEGRDGANEDAACDYEERLGRVRAEAERETSWRLRREMEYQIDHDYNLDYYQKAEAKRKLEIIY